MSEAPEAETASSLLQFTVLYGSHSSAGPVCYLLEVAGTVILLDCGWDETWDPALLEPLERVAQDIKVILISHPDINHVGALPYAYKKFKLKAPCYVTAPVLRFAHLAMYDAVLSGSALYSLDDVDSAVSKMNELKFQQPLELKLGEDKENIRIFPYAAGRSLGGAIWRVAQEPNLNVIYATDVLQRGERFWDGLALETLTASLGKKSPTLLIQDVLGMEPPVVKVPTLASSNPKAREEKFISAVLNTLRAGGDVLVPVDSVSRVLEVLLMLDEVWASKALAQTYDLVFLTRVSSVLDVASSHIEWASQKLQRKLDASNVQSPFQAGHFVVVDSVRAAFEGSGPRVVVCAGQDMAKGSFARDVFARYIAGRRECAVVLSMQSLVQGSVAQQLMAGTTPIHMGVERLVDLEGAELDEWQRQQRAKQEERDRELATEAELVGFVHEEADAAASAAVAAAASAASSTAAAPATAAMAAAIPKPALLAVKKREEDEPGAAPMFSFADADDALARRWDEYGGFVDVEPWLDDEARLAFEAARQAAEARAAAPAPTAATAAPTLEASSSAVEGEDDLGPRKRVSVTLAVDVLCQVSFYDMDGRVGKDDLQQIVKLLKPSKLVVVRSTLPRSEEFAKARQQAVEVGMASAPAPGECLDVAADSSVVRVRLPDETLSACPPATKLGATMLHVRRVRGRMALLSMAAEQSAADGARKRRMVVGAGGELPSILPAVAASAIDGEAYWVSKGEATLLNVRDVIQAAGVKTTFKEANVLHCGPSEDVCVYKPQGQRLIVSGPVGDVYFQVRKLVYASFSLV